MNKNQSHNTAVVAFQEFYEIINKLRSPEGCPWDKKQTVSSLLPHILEETYECIDAVKNKDLTNLSEELGDLYLLVTMSAFILEQTENISTASTLNGISQKLIRRHPHVFGELKVENSEQVIKIWNKIKTDVEKRSAKDSLLDTIPLSVPPLERAYKMQKEVSKVGFDWETSQDVLKKITEEINEFHEASRQNNRDEMLNEFGDILFSLINTARFMKIDPVEALHHTNQKFYKRFKYVEFKCKEKKSSMEDCTLSEMDHYWQEAKDLEKIKIIK